MSKLTFENKPSFIMFSTISKLLCVMEEETAIFKIFSIIDASIFLLFFIPAGRSIFNNLIQK